MSQTTIEVKLHHCLGAWAIGRLGDCDSKKSQSGTGSPGVNQVQIVYL